MTSSTVEAKPIAATTSTDRTGETTSAGISWLQFHRHRQAVRDRWPSLWDLPVVRSFFALAKAANLEPANVLDVGATDRVWEQPARDLWPGIDYRSLDIDRTNAHDYYDFSEVERPFELVMCFEVLEHVPASVGLQILSDCVRVCAPGGHVLVSVPNVAMPTHQLEFTHATAIGYRDLGALVTWSGLELRTMGRAFLGSSSRLMRHRYLLGSLHRALQLDYCASVVALGRKSGGGGDE